MCKFSGISSQEIFKKKHKQQQFFRSKKYHWHPKHLLPAQRRVHLNDLTCWISQRIDQSCAILIEKLHTTRLLLKGRDKTETVFLMLSGHRVDRQNSATVLFPSYLRCIFFGHQQWHEMSWQLHTPLCSPVSAAQKKRESHTVWVSLLPSQHCTSRAKEMLFAKINCAGPETPQGRQFFVGLYDLGGWR